MCAGAQYAKCEGAVGKRSCKTFGRIEIGKKPYGKWVVVGFRVARKCGGVNIRTEENSGKRVESRYGERVGDRSTNTGCPEPRTALSSVRRVGRSSDSGSLGGVGARETSSSEKNPNVVTGVTSSTTW